MTLVTIANVNRNTNHLPAPPQIHTWLFCLWSRHCKGLSTGPMWLHGWWGSCGGVCDSDVFDDLKVVFVLVMLTIRNNKNKWFSLYKYRISSEIWTVYNELPSYTWPIHSGSLSIRSQARKSAIITQTIDQIYQFKLLTLNHLINPQSS